MPPPSPPLIGFPNLVPNAAALSGGSWTVLQPLEMLRDPLLARKALSTNAAGASTRIVVDLGAAKPVRLVHLGNHNGAWTGTFTVEASANADLSAPVFTATAPLFPDVYDSEVMEWEDTAWWTGAYADADLPPPMRDSLMVLPAPVVARYWRISVSTDVAFWIGRLWLSAAWECPDGFEHGMEIGFESRTEVTQAPGGAEYFNFLSGRDVVRCTLGKLPPNHAFQRALELVQRADVFMPLLFVPRPYDSPGNVLRTSMVCRMRTLNPLILALHRRYSMGFDLVRITA